MEEQLVRMQNHPAQVGRSSKFNRLMKTEKNKSQVNHLNKVADILVLALWLLHYDISCYDLFPDPRVMLQS